MVQTKVVQKIKTHFMFNNYFFFRKSCSLWRNEKKYFIAGQATDDNTIWRMRIACWILKATNTHSQYVILIAFPLQQWLQERASLLRYTRSVNKVMRLIQYNSVLTFKLQIEFVTFKIVPLGGYTPPETLFPLFVATLVVANRNRF